VAYSERSYRRKKKNKGNNHAPRNRILFQTYKSWRKPSKGKREEPKPIAPPLSSQKEIFVKGYNTYNRNRKNVIVPIHCGARVKRPLHFSDYQRMRFPFWGNLVLEVLQDSEI
jgi:hypothetical protein